MEENIYGAIKADQAYRDAVRVNEEKEAKKEVARTKKAAEFTRDIIGPAKDGGCYGIIIDEDREINLLTDIKYILIRWGYTVEISDSRAKIYWNKK